MTYSRLFGPVGAAALTGGVQAIAFRIGLYFWSRFSLSWFYLAVLAVGPALSFLGCIRFVLHPSLQTAKLKYYAVAVLVSTELAQLIEFGRLVSWAGE